MTVRNTVADRKIWPEPWLTDHLPEEAANESEVKIKLVLTLNYNLRQSVYASVSCIALLLLLFFKIFFGVSPRLKCFSTLKNAKR